MEEIRDFVGYWPTTKTLSLDLYSVPEVEVPEKRQSDCYDCHATGPLNGTSTLKHGESV